MTSADDEASRLDKRRLRRALATDTRGVQAVVAATDFLHTPVAGRRVAIARGSRETGRLPATCNAVSTAICRLISSQKFKSTCSARYSPQPYLLHCVSSCQLQSSREPTHVQSNTWPDACTLELWIVRQPVHPTLANTPHLCTYTATMGDVATHVAGLKSRVLIRRRVACAPWRFQAPRAATRRALQLIASATR